MSLCHESSKSYFVIGYKVMDRKSFEDLTFKTENWSAVTLQVTLALVYPRVDGHDVPRAVVTKARVLSTVCILSTWNGDVHVIKSPVKGHINNRPATKCYPNKVFEWISKYKFMKHDMSSKWHLGGLRSPSFRRVAISGLLFVELFSFPYQISPSSNLLASFSSICKTNHLFVVCKLNETLSGIVWFRW